jgi:hypothetical protein
MYLAQQPNTSAEPQANLNGPSLVAPSNGLSENVYSQQPAVPYPQQQPVQYGNQQSVQYPQQQYVNDSQQYQAQASTPAYPSYQSSANVSYGNAPVQQQATMYQMPTAPRFGTQGPTPVPDRPTYQAPVPQPHPGVTPQPLMPQSVVQPDTTGATCGSCNETTCGETCCEAPCESCCTLPWYASVSGLMLSRDQANRVWTTYQTTSEANQLMNTQDIHMKWAGGGEVTVGRSFCCGLYGIEGTYWQLAKVTGHASMTHAGGVSTPLDLRYLEVGGALLTTLFDNAIEHRLTRSNEAYNAEINAVYYGQPGQGFAGHTVNWLVGARFFKFQDDLLFGSLASGTWGGAGGVNEGYLADNIENNLVGIQVGFQARSPSWHRFSTFLTTKFGLYNNHIKNDFLLYRGDGAVAVAQPASGITGTYPVHSSVNVLSTVAEVNLGIEWNFNERLSAGIGYRLISVSGIGLADNQIPDYIVDIPEISRLDSNGDLLLHGGFANITLGF